MGFRFYYLEETNLHRNRYGAMDRLKNCIRYVRYSFHARIGPGRQLADIDAPLLWLLSIVPGYVDFKRDRIRMDRQCNEKAV